MKRKMGNLKKFSINKFVIIFALLAIVSCGDEKDKYKVDPTFEPYIAKFVAEGAKRGRNFDFEKSGLKMVWGDGISQGWAGLCHYENPIRIEIDRTFWSNVAQFDDGERMHEEVIFHELAHGFVQSRGHRNDRLPSRDWASIMRGANLEDYNNLTESLNVNFRGFRRNYYLDELFNPNTKRPEWCFYEPVYDVDPNENIIWKDDYSCRRTYFPFSDGGNRIKADITSDNVYHITNCTANGMWIKENFSIDTMRNFYAKFEFKIPNEGLEVYSCFVYGASATNAPYLMVNSTGSLCVGTISNYSWDIELPNVGYVEDDFNTLEVRYIDGLYHFDLNGKFIYYTDSDSDKGGVFGFLLSPYSTLEIKNFQVSYIDNQPLLATKSYETPQTEIEVFDRDLLKNKILLK